MEQAESPGTYCTNCGQRNPPQARFCARCGTALVEIAASPTLATPTPLAPQPPSAQAARVPKVAMAYAGFAVRFGAWFIDLIITVAIVLAVAFWSDAVGIGGSHSAMARLVGFMVLASPWLYYWLFTGLRGQTPGKMVTGIIVVDERGNVPGLGRAALRELLGKAISTLVLFLGFLAIAWDDKKQGWHDKIATTYVVRRSRRS